MEDEVVVVKFTQGGQGRAVLDSAAGSGVGAGAATVVVVMEGKSGSAVFITEVIPTGSESGCSS